MASNCSLNINIPWRGANMFLLTNCERVSSPITRLTDLVSVSQDTNCAQYDLMSALAVDKCVTIVGDPDQSSSLSGVI